MHFFNQLLKPMLGGAAICPISEVAQGWFVLILHWKQNNRV
jgi:hypothetical protein